MTTYANDYSIYSISFGNAGRSTDITSEFWWNTWKDWHMVPTSRPVINPPKTRTQYVTVPGRDGPLDYSEAIDGIHFDIFTGTWEFRVLHEFNEKVGLTWSDVYSEILNTLHGRELQIIFSEHPEVCYTGRVMVDKWDSKEHWSDVTLKYELDPMQHLLPEWHLMNNEVCMSKYSGWITFDRPFISPYHSSPINRIGAYVRFEKPHPIVDKVAVYVSPRKLPKIRIRGCTKGINVAHAKVIPFIAMDDNILATGETNERLGVGIINAPRSSSTGVKQWFINPTYITPEFPNASNAVGKGKISDEVKNYKSWAKMIANFDDNTVM